MCRFRPIIQNEKKYTKESCIISLNNEEVEIKSKNEYNNFTFHFDHIFNMDSTQKNNIQKTNINQVKKSLKEKMNFHSINNINKFKEYNKYSFINNASNIQDEQSQDYCYDLSNIKLSSKSKKY